MSSEVPLKRTIDLICTKFEAAENEVRIRVQDSFPGAEEEQITLLLQECLHEALRHASDSGQIEQAFASDLRASQSGFDYLDPETASSGLVAEASWHKRATEAKTGGDFGLLLVRPRVTYDGLAGRITITDGHHSGLLVQAKRKPFNGKWRGLSRTQISVLPQRLGYSALVLYELLDVSNRELAPVQWQLCEKHEVTTVERWLKEGSFPQLVPSRDIITGLGKGTIGTNDRKIIENFVTPAGERTLVIRIHWPDGEPPSSEVHVKHKSEVAVQVLHG